MSKPITTTTSVGTIISSDVIDNMFGKSTYTKVRTDDGSELFSTSQTENKFSVGDRVSFTITDGPLGKIPSGFKKTP
ncbi:hypothetical protein [Pseudomonas fluorescens]|uniref:hypothetical protein n=1 Tax=Pseudomonas fluorescens TaxID=294 RepID=UPI0007D0649D|nr:hypothetical protein [Pseudomonas fluorescens]